MSMMRFSAYLVLLAGFGCAVSSAEVVDSIQFGNPASEEAHQLTAELSEVFAGGLGVKARRFLPPAAEGWRGGRATFEMAVDPEAQNYCTVKMWGGYFSEKNAGRMTLFIDGKQVGQRHLGEIEILDIAKDEPRFPGRFFYKTVPLPLAMTQGKERVQLTIEGQGPVWVYGNQIEKFQNMMKIPSRGVYRAYTHIDPSFEPLEDEVQGDAVVTLPVRSGDDSGVVAKVEQRVNRVLEKLMAGDDHMGQQEVSLMARAYHEPWTKVYHSKDALRKMVRAIDCQYLVYQGELESEDGSSWDRTWRGFGRTANAVRLLENELKPYLNQPIAETDVNRKEGWAEMFAASRDLNIGKRRLYTNQSMIVDTHIYLCNRGVAAINPSMAWPEEKALLIMYESMGIKPWSGEWDEDGNPNWRQGDDYFQFTEIGLSKELGYVGAYGETVVSLGTDIYEATRPSYHEDGDAKIKNKLVEMTKARAVFRHPGQDADGCRSMRLEAVVGWRDYKFPGPIVYDEVPGRESLPFGAASATLDSELIGYAQQSMEDNQYFLMIEGMLKNGTIQMTAKLLDVPSSYRLITAQPNQPYRLPMAEGQPDFVFSDPEDGVVAIKNGDDILFVSLYWRARYAINNLAKIHHITPQIERDVVAYQETRFKDSGEVFVMPDQANEPFSRRHEKFYKSEGLYLAEAGIEQPVAEVPAKFSDFKVGKENIYAGKGSFYLLEYGDYLIAMNCTKDESFEFDVPEPFRGAKDLVSGDTIKQSKHTAQPWQTVVLVRMKE
ncbi:hypothetical protein P4C99_07145 [Pontiellaceae bacterium B1224]|nr:hypothetical protein [Pontiellaceae bacterium B1224]